MGLSRRDFLCAALGAPVALAACKRAPAPRRFSGRLLGQSVDLGHGLTAAPPTSPGEAHRTGVLIVGGGIAGLTAAWRLQRAGFEDFVLLELEPSLGGTSTSGPDHPWGAHYVPTPEASNVSLVALLTELGEVEGRWPDGRLRFAEQTLCRSPHERLFYKGTWYEGLYLHAGASADDLRQLEAFEDEVRRLARLRDRAGRRAFCLPSALASDDEQVLALDRLSMAAWLDQRGYTSPRLRWLVEYGSRDDYGLDLGQVSAWAGLFYFAARLDSTTLAQGEVLTWPEGNGRLVRHLATVAGARARSGCLVADLSPAARGVEATCVDTSRGVVERWEAAHAICATPAHVTRHLVGPYRASPPAHLLAFGSTPWVVANVHLDGRPDSHGFPTAWDNVLYESRSLGYVVATHQAGLDRGPTTWTWYLPLCADDPRAPRRELLEAGWDRWADAVVSDLGRAHQGFAERVTSLDVFRWGHAMVRPTVGFRSSPQRVRAAEPLGAIHFAHAGLSGLPLVEEAVWHGVRAAEEVLTARGVRFEPLR